MRKFVVLLFVLALAVAGASAQQGMGLLDQVQVQFNHCGKYLTNGKLTDQGRELCLADPTTIYHVDDGKNLITNAGWDMIASALSNTATQAAACNYIAMTADTTAMAATDTTLTSELTTNGLGRAQGTYAHSAGTKIWTVAKTFTYSTTGSQSIGKVAVFNAASSGTYCWGYVLGTAQTVSNNGDTITVTWTHTGSEV